MLGRTHRRRLAHPVRHLQALSQAQAPHHLAVAAHRLYHRVPAAQVVFPVLRVPAVPAVPALHLLLVLQVQAALVVQVHHLR